VRRAFSVAALLVAAGCGGMNAAPPRTFDLGDAALRATLPAVRLDEVRSVAPFDEPDMWYRLAWRNPQELASFAQSRWAATPAELLRRRLQRANGEGAAKCVLEIEIHEFTQVFTAKDVSEARVELRASLSGASPRITARSFALAEPGAGAEAASGAGAFARATDRAIAELAGWVASQPGCR